MSDSLDTCTILALIIGEPVEQRDEAWSLLEDNDTVHYIADLAISEAVHVLEAHYGQSRKDIVYSLNKFLTVHDKVLSYNRDLYELVLPFYEKHPQLSFNDCCLAFYAELNHAEPLWTFDKNLAKKHASAKLL